MRTSPGRGLCVRVLTFALLIPSPGRAQHEAHGSMSHQPSATSVLGIPMDRMGSGTTWIPDAVSLPSRHWDAGKWNFMLHGFVFAQYDRQQGARGDEQFGSLNWAMLMASRSAGGGVFQGRTMLSLDPWTVTARGYPLLLQTGETYQGAELRDRQHPHDFWMELGVLYERPVSSRAALSLYAAPSGEPALGPVAFMHRPSAMDDPVAPLSHHWQDATHISYGVVTGGLVTRKWKLEASRFNGREPDERRFAVDPIRFDSYSGRLTVNPTEHWSATAGYGYLHSPEALDPGESQRRFVASLMHGARLGERGQWSTTAVWGANRTDKEWSGALLLESEALIERNTLFARAEVAPRTGDDLALPGVAPDAVFRVGSVSLGYIRELARGSRFTVGAGARLTANVVPASLEPEYGSRTPAGFLLFLRVRPVHGVTMQM